MSALYIRGLGKTLGETELFSGVDLDLKPGEIGCLLGPSGCGKTTLLRILAGFETAAAGRVELAGRLVVGAGKNVPPEARHIGMVFQDYALFPHLNAAENVAFGLRGAPRSERAARVAECLAAVGLPDASSRYAHELSGGQQQRVALARALAPRPELLLLDEPFSSLDARLRERLCLEVRDIIKTQNATALMVTHSRDEAFAMADRVGVLAGGQLHQWATPQTLYAEPATALAAAFGGDGAFLDARMEGSAVRCALGLLPNVTVPACGDDSNLRLLVRPEDVFLDDAGPVAAVVREASFLGAAVRYRLRLESGEAMDALYPGPLRWRPGETVRLTPRFERLVLLPAPDVEELVV